jgi:hypothetical protein
VPVREKSFASVVTRDGAQGGVDRKASFLQQRSGTEEFVRARRVAAAGVHKLATRKKSSAAVATSFCSESYMQQHSVFVAAIYVCRR